MPRKEIKQKYMCPISDELMTDSVVAADGFSYERKNIATWLQNHNTSPMTNLPLTCKTLFPNNFLNTAIKEYKEKHKICTQEEFIKIVYTGDANRLKKEVGYFQYYIDCQEQDEQALDGVSKNAPLHIAASLGHVEMIKFLVDEGAKVRIRNSKSEFPLHTAARCGKLEAFILLFEVTKNIENGDQLSLLEIVASHGHKEIMNFLISKKFNLESYSESNQRRTALLSAALAGEINAVKMLLIAGANPNARDINGNTFLNLACKKGNNKLITELLGDANNENHQFLLETKNNDGDTPLLIATKNNQIETIKILLNARSDVTAKNNAGETALIVAIKNKNINIAQLFIETDALIIRDSNGLSPLELAEKLNFKKLVLLIVNQASKCEVSPKEGSTSLHLAIENGFISYTYILLERKINVNASDQYVRTPFHVAAMKGNKRVLTLLLRYGALMDVKDNVGNTALHYAAINGHKECLAFLLDFSLSLETKNNAGQTVLHLAAHNGHSDCVELLLTRGASMMARDNDGCTALHHAAGSMNGNIDCINLLLNDITREAKDKGGCTALHCAALQGHKEGLLKLLQGNIVNLEIVDDLGRTPLHYASMGNQKDCVAFLLDCGAAIEAKDSHSNWTALHYAASMGHEECASLLISCGASIDLVDMHGQTPLHCSLNGKGKDCVFLLLSRGASIEAKDKYNKTVFHHAASYGDADGITLLLSSFGGNPLITIEDKDFNGWTALHYAAYEGHENCVALLLEHRALIEVANDNSQTPLHLTVEKNRKNCLKLLVEKSANIFARDNKNETAYETAIRNNHNELADFILKIQTEKQEEINEKATNMFLQDRFSESLTYYRQLAELIPDDKSIRLAIKRTTIAIQYQSRLEETKNSYQRSQNLADLKQVIATYQSWFHEDPLMHSSHKAELLRSKIQFMNQIEILKNHVKANFEEGNFEETVELIDRIFMLLQEKDEIFKTLRTKAEEWLKQISEANSLYERGYSYFEKRDFNNSEPLLSKALKIQHPKRQQPINSVLNKLFSFRQQALEEYEAGLEFLNVFNFNEAQNLFTKALANDPSLNIARIALQQTLHRQKNFPCVNEIIKHAISTAIAQVKGTTNVNPTSELDRHVLAQKLISDILQDKYEKFLNSVTTTDLWQVMFAQILADQIKPIFELVWHPFRPDDIVIHIDRYHSYMLEKAITSYSRPQAFSGFPAQSSASTLSNIGVFNSRVNDERRLSLVEPEIKKSTKTKYVDY